MDSGPMVGVQDITKDSPEVHSLELQVRLVRVVVFLALSCRTGADAERAGRWI